MLTKEDFESYSEIESFKKTKTHFEIVKQIIKSKGVNLIMSKSK
jgi:hypothetical protein